MAGAGEEEVLDGVLDDVSIPFVPLRSFLGANVVFIIFFFQM